MIRVLKPESWFGVSRKWRAEAWYLPIMALAMGLMMLRPLLFARLFDASGFATYSAGLLVSSTFCMLGCLGLQPMLQRKMPMDLIGGRELASLVLLVQSVLVAVFCAVLAGGFVFAGLAIESLNPEGVAISLLHGLSQQFFLLATVESRSRGQPLRFSGQNLTRALFVIVGAGLAGWFTRSATTALFIEAMISLAVGWRIVMKVLAGSPFHFRALLTLACKRITKVRWLEAFALMAVLLIGFALINFDRWLAASWLPPQEFAVYAFAWIILTAAQSVQSVVNSSVFPSLARRYAVGGRSSSFKLAATISIVFLLVGIFFAIPAYHVLRFLISKWFADYSWSISLVPIFIAVAALRISDFWSSHLIVVGRERLLFLINLLVGIGVLSIWFGLDAREKVGDGLFLQFAWLAFTLTLTNYIFVIVAAVRIRK